MKSAFLRAGVPIYYSEGFNPHPKMVFALPLSIGVESVCEFLDIKITEPMAPEEIRGRLNANLTDELQIIDVYSPKSKFSEISWAEYEIVYETPADCRALEEKTIIVEKQTKSGVKTVDIKPQIRSYSSEGNVLTAILDAGTDNYLNPEYVAALAGGEHSIIRKNVFKADMSKFK